MADAALEHIERELERIGILLEHDAELPSVTAIVAGGPIRGSWWGHPLGHRIYDLLGQLADRSGRLAAKIVNGKITYVHPRLWDAFLTVAADARPERLRGLSPLALGIRDEVMHAGEIRADQLPTWGPGARPAREITQAIRDLETRLLLHTGNVHTESGAHAKVLMTWAAWAAGRGVKISSTTPLGAARAALDRAVDALRQDSSRQVKIPW
jgi:hypothetical protein